MFIIKSSKTYAKVRFDTDRQFPKHENVDSVSRACCPMDTI